jgi:hypothetical protein
MCGRFRVRYRFQSFSNSRLRSEESGCHSRRRKLPQEPDHRAYLPLFAPLAFLLSVYQSEGWLVGAVGIELKATLKARKLLILLNEKNSKTPNSRK